MPPSETPRQALSESKSMQQTATTRRVWRLGRTGSTSDPNRPGEHEETPALNPRAVGEFSIETAANERPVRRSATGFYRAVRDWLAGRPRRVAPACVDFEEMIH